MFERERGFACCFIAISALKLMKQGPRRCGFTLFTLGLDAPHPGSFRRLWQTLSNETDEFENDPSVSVWVAHQTSTVRSSPASPAPSQPQQTKSTVSQQGQAGTVPQAIQVEMHPPGEIDGEYLRLPHVVGLRPVYKRDSDNYGGPYYLLFSSNHWCNGVSEKEAHGSKTNSCSCQGLVPLSCTTVGGSAEFQN